MPRLVRIGHRPRMNVTVKDQSGYLGTYSVEGENMTLGMALQKFTCRCGAAHFVDGGRDTLKRPPDLVCHCGLEYWFREDEAEQTGYLSDSATP